ncbi:acetyl-CoA synthetase [Streptomyces griseorubiginosus]|uniref:acetyl-CoA synthetase n=1 Tax=Streptomyces griseorubiginosus TaxID=67304 RepID=UPI00200CD0DC|nr:acetyl-CoA synthetase [Streptomyces griseorubiginosus]
MPPSSQAPSASASSPPASGAGCVAGRAQITVSPGDPVRRPVCVRPGTVVSLVLSPRTDGKRWTAVRSSAPALVLVTGRQVAADGTAHVSLRAAGTRGGSAEITVSAKEPDLAGTGGVGFTLAVTVTPYAREG